MCGEGGEFIIKHSKGTYLLMETFARGSGEIKIKQDRHENKRLWKILHLKNY